jgi:anti-sigma factor (TIGR02949 family)
METTATELTEVKSANTDCEKVINILEMIIDNEASSEDQTYFYNHLEDCSSCFEAHKQQKMLKSFLKMNVKSRAIPVSLISTIKKIVQETA